MKYAALDKLNDLKERGVISEEEFRREKDKILNEHESSGNYQEDTNSYWGMDEKTYAMTLHLSQLSSFIVPMLGLVLPIIMWLVFKNKNEFINQNGKDAINWIISSTIYVILSIFLCFVIIGIPILITLLLLDVIFCIMAAVKASDGKNWAYPMSIRFIV